MTRRLLISYIGLAILILAVLELPLAVVAGRHDRGLAAQAVEREATGLAVFASADMQSGRLGDLEALAARYKTQTGGEVAVFDTNGTVIARSDPESDSDAHAQRDRQTLVDVALTGRPADSFGADEGRPWAAAAVPVSVGGQPGGAVLLGVPADATEDRIHAIWLALGLVGVALVGFTALIGIWLARSVTRPLERLEATVADFAEGNLEARAPTVGPPEIRDLSEQFNRMAARLSELIGAQRRFVADASHQLRSPLTALRLRLELLESEAEAAAGSESAGGHTAGSHAAGNDTAEPAAAAGIAAAGREVQRLSRIVDGLLTLGRAEGEAPARRPVDVVAVLRERCDSWAALAGERRIELSCDPGPWEQAVAPLVPGDLDQMVDNLLANALDALDAGGRVVVRLATGPDRHLTVHVTDNGPGMSTEDRSRAFDRFWQGPAGRGGHSGLGLAIVRQLADRNDAEVVLLQGEPTGLDAVLTLSSMAPPSPATGQANTKERQKMLS